MNRKSLSSTNAFLKAPGARKKIARNAASSTAIETGKPSSKYIRRAVECVNRETSLKP